MKISSSEKNNTTIQSNPLLNVSNGFNIRLIILNLCGIKPWPEVQSSLNKMAETILPISFSKDKYVLQTSKVIKENF